MIKAYFSPRVAKKPLPYKVNITLEKLRHFIRLSYEMGHIPLSKYRRIAEQIDDIGRQVGGWMKSLP